MSTNIKLYNSLNRSKENFTPIEADHIKMYVCGPTVYDRAHIGNARAIVVFDIWFRLLRQCFPQVTYVRNITDVDDKINTKAQETGLSISDITQETTRMFHEDMAALNCLHPTIEPRATEHIPQMVTMISSLIEQGYAYEAEGHVLFAVSSYNSYGNLSRRSQEELIAGARIEVAPYKRDPGDFVLWKPSIGNDPAWESPWGLGRPGWHIECSVMSTHYLGQDFDIHGGGADLQFPHHENEIAQSCCAYPGSHYAKHWVHNGFLTVNGEKMSKSLGNFITVEQALTDDATNNSGQTIRCLFLNTHYRKPLDWNDKAVSDARKTMDYFYQALEAAAIKEEASAMEIPSSLIDTLCDDLNTANYMAELHTIAKQIHTSEDQQQRVKLGQTLLAAGKLVGLFFKENHYITPEEWFSSNASDDIQALVEQIKQARADKNWPEADRLRDEIQAQGYQLEYLPGGDIKIK